VKGSPDGAKIFLPVFSTKGLTRWVIVTDVPEVFSLMEIRVKFEKGNLGII
jgi:hypothetical protein